MYTYFLESITGNPIQILIFAAMLLLRNQPAYPHTELGVSVISPVITNTFCQSLGVSLPVEPLFRLARGNQFVISRCRHIEVLFHT